MRLNKAKLRAISNKGRSIKNTLIRSNPTEVAKRRIVKFKYREASRAIRIKRSESTKIAVVIHLYYPDSWSLFAKSIARIDDKFDLFITLPSKNAHFAKNIIKDFENAQVIIVPNHGRDVLPFLIVLKVIRKLGYVYVLKLHSKKSTHRTDGSRWLETMVNDLLPTNPEIMKQMLRSLEYKDTGIIGPNNQYLNLSVNFEANGRHMTKILTKIYSREVANQVLQTNRLDYGFFAGTMFWARLDALKPILDQSFEATDFESESGQIDGTMSHALERVLSLVSEIENRKMYEVSPMGVKLLSYKTDNIPDWSDVYIGP